MLSLKGQNSQGKISSKHFENVDCSSRAKPVGDTKIIVILVTDSVLKLDVKGYQIVQCEKSKNLKQIFGIQLH